MVAGVFPVKWLFEALVVVYDRATTGVGLSWTDIGVLAALEHGHASHRPALVPPDALAE